MKGRERERDQGPRRGPEGGLFVYWGYLCSIRSVNASQEEYPGSCAPPAGVSFNSLFHLFVCRFILLFSPSDRRQSWISLDYCVCG